MWLFFDKYENNLGSLLRHYSSIRRTKSLSKFLMRFFMGQITAIEQCNLIYKNIHWGRAYHEETTPECRKSRWAVHNCWNIRFCNSVEYSVQNHWTASPLLFNNSASCEKFSGSPLSWNRKLSCVQSSDMGAADARWLIFRLHNSNSVKTNRG